MSKIKNGGLDQYGAEPLEHQQFGTAGVEGVKNGRSEVTVALSQLPLLLISTAQVSYVVYVFRGSQ